MIGFAEMININSITSPSISVSIIHDIHTSFLNAFMIRVEKSPAKTIAVLSHHGFYSSCGGKE